MKRTIFFVIVMIFTLSSTMAFANKSDSNSETEKSKNAVKTENKLTDEEIDKITERVEEIRKVDKSDLTGEEKSELKKELKEIKKEMKKSSGTIYIGGTTLILIIILILLLA